MISVGLLIEMFACVLKFNYANFKSGDQLPARAIERPNNPIVPPATD